MLNQAVALADEGLSILRAFNPQDGKTEAELLKIRIAAQVQTSGRSASISADITRANSLLLNILTKTDKELNQDTLVRLTGIIGPKIQSAWEASNTATELAEDALNTRLPCAALLADIRLLDAKSHLAMGELQHAHEAGAAAGELISTFLSELAPRGEVTAVYIDKLRRVVTSVLAIRALTQARSGAYAESTALLRLASTSTTSEAQRGTAEDGVDRVFLEAFVLSNDLTGARAFFSPRTEHSYGSKDGRYFSAALLRNRNRPAIWPLGGGGKPTASATVCLVFDGLATKHLCAPSDSLRSGSKHSHKGFSEAQELSRSVLQNQWNFPDHLLLAWAGAILAESSKKLDDQVDERKEKLLSPNTGQHRIQNGSSSPRKVSTTKSCRRPYDSAQIPPFFSPLLRERSHT